MWYVMCIIASYVPSCVGELIALLQVMCQVMGNRQDPRVGELIALCKFDAKLCGTIIARGKVGMVFAYASGMPSRGGGSNTRQLEHVTHTHTVPLLKIIGKTNTLS